MPAPKSSEFAKKFTESFNNYQSFKALRPKPKEAVADEEMTEEEKKKKKEQGGY